MEKLLQEMKENLATFVMLSVSFHDDRDLRLNEIGVLIYALRNPHTTPTMLKNYFNIPKPSVTSLLNPLEKKKYITRKVSAEDRRVVYVIPTAKAKAAIEKFYADFDLYAERVADKLGQERIEELVASLKEMNLAFGKK